MKNGKNLKNWQTENYKIKKRENWRFNSALPIKPPPCDLTPAPWWDRECDKSLLIGTWKHGYESYPEMRSDPALCFLARCGPATDHSATNTPVPTPQPAAL